MRNIIQKNIAPFSILLLTYCYVRLFCIYVPSLLLFLFVSAHALLLVECMIKIDLCIMHMQQQSNNISFSVVLTNFLYLSVCVLANINLGVGRLPPLKDKRPAEVASQFLRITILTVI